MSGSRLPRVSGPWTPGVLAVVGVGLVGGSIAGAARCRWPTMRIVGVDRRAVLRDALARGLITEAVDLPRLGSADLIVLATPVRVTQDLLRQLADIVPGRAVVTDTGSTKRAVMAAAAALPGRLAFVGGHPIAGDSRGGLGAARADLFAGRPWALVAGRGRAVTRVAGFVRALGARPVRLDAATHDRLLGAVSHLPQLVSSALMAVVGARTGAAGLALGGSGLCDATRLAASPPDIWRDILATNADMVGSVLDDLVVRLEQLRRGLSSPAVVTAAFDEARHWRRVLKRRSAACSLSAIAGEPVELRGSITSGPRRRGHSDRPARYEQGSDQR